MLVVTPLSRARRRFRAGPASEISGIMPRGIDAHVLVPGFFFMIDRRISQKRARVVKGRGVIASTHGLKTP
jgi:hypothetical protein